ncbi:hypothetical protein EDC01DRAFT_789770 [Geopyxis carbonaria]|nr:hypothetical protein EDC01DRAFT_789770 [Geopyxis carbonaria]
MDDLTGIQWTAPRPPSASTTRSTNTSSTSTPQPSTNAFANLSLSTASSRTASPAATTKGADSFSNLTPFGARKTATLSLAEQQRELEARRRADAEEKRRKLDAMFGGGGGLDALGGGGGGGAFGGQKVEKKEEKGEKGGEDGEEDLFAAFNAKAPVDNASHYPPPQQQNGGATAAVVDGFDLLGGGGAAYPASMDPFENPPSRKASPFPPTQQTQMAVQDDDDILGDLAKPVSELPRPQPTPSPQPQRRAPSTDPRDPAIAEIMDMGFTAEQARRALGQTETGLDVEGAVGWLLEDAHRKSRPASTNPERSSSAQRSREASGSRTRRTREENDAAVPVWARKQEGEKDVAAIAADIGGTLFKSANSLWSAGRKKVEKAVAEFQTDLADGGGDPNMPKWMRERQIREQLEARGARGISRADRPPPEDRTRPEKGTPEPEITDEAMMLEMGSGPPPPRRKQKERAAPPSSSSMGRDEIRPDLGRSQEQVRRQQAVELQIQQKEREMRERQLRAHAAQAIPDSASRKAKLAAEAMPQYVSSKRRRPPPASASPKPVMQEADLLNGGGSSSGSNSNNPFAHDAAAGRFLDSNPSTPRATPPPAPAARRPAPTPSPRPASVQRTAVPLSPSALASSTAARQKGTEAFKRGDYSLAQTLYTTSLSGIPDTHPLRIILLANRSLATFKLGDPKSALGDVEELLAIIGPARGAGESIPLDGASKDMADYWAKAQVRKAECLEQLERWAPAKAAWESAIAAGVGGAVASAGKRRCETALAPKAALKPKPAPRPKPVSTPSGRDAAAVQKLRQANAASDRVEAEKLALHDVVGDRVNAWKAGKEGNLRALLAGLDTVLWEGSGWRKVGMGELLVPQRVKVQYMKGIAKVHPDKIKPDATTEQRMISAAVFSLLNDSWDGFKAENGL